MSYFSANGRRLAIECPGFCGIMQGQNIQDVAGTSADEAHFIGDSSEERTVELIFAYCKPCPWGMRSGHQSTCRPCALQLHSYDYMFLVFHALIPFFVNATAIGYHIGRLKPNQKRHLWLFSQTLSALLESSLALLCALLLFNPMWQLRTFGCQKEGTLREWYSMWHNPMLNYNRILRCSYELVYPLFSLPFVVYAFSLVNLIVFRSLLYAIAAWANGRRNLLPAGPLFSGLWTIPLLALGHALLSGFLYALFPYLALCASLVLLVVHLAAQSSPNQQPSGRSGLGICGMFQRLFCCFSSTGRCSTTACGGPSLLLALFIHLVLFAFALLSLAVAGTPSGQFSELYDSNRVILLLAIPPLLPVPLFFFILTVRLTAPNSNSASSTRTFR